MATDRTGPLASESRQSWRVHPNEAAVGWGMVVVGVLAASAAVSGVVVLATAGAVLPVSSEGPPAVDVVAAAALEQGLLTSLAAVVSVALLVAGLGVLRSGRDTAHLTVLRVGLVPSAGVAVAGELWAVAVAMISVLAVAEMLLRRR